MLSELIVVLSGYPGSILMKDENEHCINIADEFPFIHLAEKGIIERICTLASHYTKLKDFLDMHGQTPLDMPLNNVPSRRIPGVYISAFCQGLNDVIIPYKKTLVDLESQLLNDPDLTIPHIQSSLERYQLLFAALSEVVQQITVGRLCGCDILELVFRATSSGIPDVKDAFKYILRSCHQALYKQLTAWMLNGMLIDQFSECFIFQNSRLSALNTNFQNLSGAVSDRKSDENEEYRVNSEKVPFYIPLVIAEKILFIGESVRMFEIQTRNGPSIMARSMIQDKEMKFSTNLFQLSTQMSFDIMTFENVIDGIRIYAAKRLWQLLVNETNLASQLRVMKDFYLLGRGELFREFIDLTQQQLRIQTTRCHQHDVNIAFQQAAHNVFLDNEALLKRFSFILESKHAIKSVTESNDKQQGSHKSSAQKDLSGWSYMQMVYTVDPPLHIFFTKCIFVRYNTLFNFLLFVKRVQLELQQCWALQMKLRHLHHPSNTGDSSKWWLRNHMAFLVDNLQYYLQVDVIESQFSLLLARIEETQDFEAIRLAHDQFLSALHNQCFLHMKQISHCLNEILQLCHAFCCIVNHSNAILSAQEILQMNDITQGFQRQTSLLFRILSNVRSHQFSPHFAQLLFLIDFNRFFSTTHVSNLEDQTSSNIANQK